MWKDKKKVDFQSNSFEREKKTTFSFILKFNLQRRFDFARPLNTNTQFCQVEKSKRRFLIWKMLHFYVIRSEWCLYKKSHHFPPWWNQVYGTDLLRFNWNENQFEIYFCGFSIEKHFRMHAKIAGSKNFNVLCQMCGFCWILMFSPTPVRFKQFNWVWLKTRHSIQCKGFSISKD